MKLDEHIGRVVDRSRAFYRKTEPGHYLINAEIPADAPPIPPLCEFDLDRQPADWLDSNPAAAQPVWLSGSSRRRGHRRLCPGPVQTAVKG